MADKSAGQVAGQALLRRSGYAGQALLRRSGYAGQAADCCKRSGSENLGAFSFAVNDNYFFPSKQLHIPMDSLTGV